MTSPLPQRLLAEFFGTFALIFFGTGAVVVNEAFGGSLTHTGVSLAWGLIVMVLIYALGDLSGAHLNPTVSVGFTVAGRFPASELFPYILVQCISGFTFFLPLLGDLPRFLSFTFYAVEILTENWFQRSRTFQLVKS